MKNFRLILCIILFMSINGCNNNNKGVTPEDADTNSRLIQATKSQAGFESVSKARGTETGSDPFQILDVTVNNSFLEITVQYGGGCKEHTFEAFWNGDYYPTFVAPTLAPIILNHQANGDGCKALITEKLKVDVKKLFGDNYSTDVLMPIVLNGSSDQSIPAELAGNCDFRGTVIIDSTLDDCKVYINLDNGVVLEPLLPASNHFILTHLQRVSLSYVAQTEVSACMGGQVAALTCIQKIGQGANIHGVVKQYKLDGCNFIIELEDGTKLEPAELMVKNFVFRDNQQVWLSYVELNQPSTCMLGKTVRITGITEIK